MAHFSVTAEPPRVRLRLSGNPTAHTEPRPCCPAAGERAKGDAPLRRSPGFVFRAPASALARARSRASPERRKFQGTSRPSSPFVAQPHCTRAPAVLPRGRGLWGEKSRRSGGVQGLASSCTMGTSFKDGLHSWRNPEPRIPPERRFCVRSRPA